MYDPILVPTDGSQEMSTVVDQAIELASICESTLHVLHVVDERAYHSVPDDAREQVRETLRDDAESFTKSIAETGVQAGIDVTREIRWGDPAQGILSYAAENGIELIVMGTHGRTGYEHYLLGSVAEKVVRMAPMSVLVIAVGDTDEKRRAILTAATEVPSLEEQPLDVAADEPQGADAEETPFES